jgi:hypothetical protein
MSRADDVKRALEWHETWIGDFDDSEPYWMRRVEGLADDFAAVRAETLEAAAMAGMGASMSGPAHRRQRDDTFIRAAVARKWCDLCGDRPPDWQCKACDEYNALISERDALIRSMKEQP